MFLEELLLRLLESHMLAELLRIFLKLDLAFYLLSVLGGVIYLTCLFVLDDNEVVLNFCHSCIMIAQNSLIIKK